MGQCRRGRTVKNFLAFVFLVALSFHLPAQTFKAQNLTVLGTGIGTTPSQYDNGVNYATTAFVQRNGVAYRGTGAGFAINTTLNAGHFGGWGLLQAASLTVSLPAISTVPAGQSFTLLGGAFGGTLAANGAENIVHQDATTSSAVYVGPTQSITVVSNGTGSAWFITNTGFGREHTCPNILDYGGDASGTNTNTAALTAALVAGPSGRKCVFFPPGKFKFNTGFTYSFSGSLDALTMQGSGSDVTELYFPNNTTGMQFNYNGPYNSTHFHDFTVTTGVVNDNVPAFTLSQTMTTISNPGNSATSEFQNITIRGSDGYAIGNYFGNAIVVNSVSAVNFINVTIFGNGGVGNGINLFGSNTAIPVVFNLSNCTINATNVGLAYGNNVQGVTVNQSNFTGNQYGIYAPAGESGLDQLSVTGSQFNNFSGNINLNTEIQNTNITNNLFLVQPNTFSIYMPKTAMFAIIGNTFEQATGTITGTNGITTFGWQYGGGIITGNGFYNLVTGVWIQAGSQNVNVQGNVYYGTSNHVVNSCTSGCSVGAATQ